MSTLRFFAVPEDRLSRSIVENAEALGLEALDLGTTRIFLSPRAKAAMQPASDAIVIGNRYHRSPSSTTAPAARCDLSGVDPDRLLTDYWGDYVCLRAAAKGVDVYRSPSGAMPAYYLRSQPIVASDCDLLIEMELVSGSVDWQACARDLVYAEPLFADTALDDVSELLPGGSLRFLGDRFEQASWWNPWDHVTEQGELSQPGAQGLLRETITRCVRTQLASRSHYVARVSGGLDSSIVAASLHPDDDRAKLVMFVAGDGEGDERYHGRLLARHLGRALYELHYDVDGVDLATASYPGLPGPRGRHMAQTIRRMCDRELGSDQGGAVVTGFGGDALFCFLMSVRPIVDRFRASGIAAAVETTIDLARLTQSSIAETSFKALRHVWRGHRPCRPRANCLFIDRNRAYAVSQAPMHPWIQPPNGGLPGADMHIAMILGSLRHVEHSASTGETPEIAVLMAQPVIEACLAIPSWTWCRGGQDRAIARAAFADLLPHEIAYRASKGGPDAFCSRIVATKKDALRSQLLDGRLAQERVVDRTAIEAALSDERSLTMVETVRLLQLSDAEAWAAERLCRARALPTAMPRASRASE